MSNSSLLDPNAQLNIPSISGNKELELSNRSKVKEQSLTQKTSTLIPTPENYIDPLTRAENRNRDYYNNTIGRIDPKAYETIINSLASDQGNESQLQTYLQKQYGFDKNQIDYITNDVRSKVGIRKNELYQPAPTKAETLLGDLGVAAVQGARQNIEQPLTGLAAQGARAISKVLPENAANAVGDFTDNLLVDQSKSIQNLDKRYSTATQEAMQNRADLVNEFERTAEQEYPNGFARFAAGTLKGIEGFVDNPRLFAVEAAKEVSNFAGAAAAGAIGKAVLTRGLSKKDSKEWLAGKGAETAEKISSAMGIGYITAQEGLSNGIQAKVDVLDKSHEELMQTSPDYAVMIEKGMTPAQAKRALSDRAFDIAFAVSASTAALTSWALKTGKMEADAFRGSEMLQAGGLQALEESVQNTAGQYGQNLATQQTTDPTQRLDQGLGVAAGEGAVLGAAMGTGLSATASLLDGSAKDATVAAFESVANSKLGKKVAESTPVKKIGVVFNSKANQFTKENQEKVFKGDYTDLKGDTVEDIVNSVLDKSTMEYFNSDPDKYKEHLNKLAEVVSNKIDEDSAKLTGNETQEEKDAIFKSHVQAAIKINRIVQGIAEQEAKEANLPPLAEDATDEEKAARILTFNSLRIEDDPLFDDLSNLANSPSLDSESKKAISSLANVRQALNDLRSKGSEKGLSEVSNDVLKGSRDWRGVDTYVSNIINGLKANVPNISNYNLKEFQRFRDNRKKKFDLANAYVTAKTSEARQAAADAYMKEFGKSSKNLRDRAANKQILISRGLMDAIAFEYQAVEKAYSGMANLVQTTRGMKKAVPATTQTTEAQTIQQPNAVETATASDTTLPSQSQGEVAVSQSTGSESGSNSIEKIKKAKTREDYLTSIRELGQSLPEDSVIYDPDIDMEWSVKKGTTTNGTEYVEFSGEGNALFFFSKKKGEDWVLGGELSFPTNPEIRTKSNKTSQEDVGYVAPQVDPEVSEIIAMGSDSKGTPVEPIEDTEEFSKENSDEVQADKEQEPDEQTESEATTESKETSERKEQTENTKISKEDKQRRINAIKDSKYAPPFIKKTIEENGINLATKTLIKFEKTVAKNEKEALEREQAKADRQIAADKINEFSTPAYNTILGTLMEVSSMPKEELKTFTKNVVKNLKKKLEDKNVTVKALLETVNTYAQGIKDAAFYDEPLSENKTYLTGFRVGKSVRKTISRGDFFLHDRLKNTHNPELSEMFIAIAGKDIKEFMQKDKPLEYVIEQLQQKLADRPDQLNNLVEYLRGYVAAFDRTVDYKNPSWKSFSVEGIQMLRKSDGLFPEALKVVFAVDSLMWIKDASKLKLSTKQEVAERFGKREDDLTPEGYLALQDKGDLLSNVNDALSRGVLNSLGLGIKSNVNHSDRNNFINSIGHLSLVTLENMGLINFDLISLDDVAKYFSYTEESTKRLLDDSVEFEDIVSKPPTEKKGRDTAFTNVQLVELNKASSELEGLLDLLTDAPTLETMEELFDQAKEEKIPSLEEPTLDDMPKKYKGTDQDVPDEVREAYLVSSKRKWKLKGGVSFLVEKFFSAEQVAMLEGGIADVGVLPKYIRDSEEARFRALVEEAKNTRKHLVGLKDKALYLLPEAWRIGRTGYKNVLLNPQASKVARHSMTMEDWERDVDMDNPKQAGLFRMALAFNLGIDLDKNSPKEVFKKLDELLANPLFIEAVDAYDALLEYSENEDNPDFEFDGSEAEAMGRFFEIMTSKQLFQTSSWAKIDAIAQYSVMRKANGKPFKTNIMVEIDGITNGVAIANVIFGIYDKDTLAKVGIYFEPSDQSDYVEWSKNSSNLDSYKTLAKYTEEMSKWLREAGIRLMGKFIDNRLTEKELSFLRYTLGLSKTDTLTVDVARNILKKSKAALAVAGSFYDANGSITRAWRKLSKEPLMTTNYGAGIFKVVSNLIEEIVVNMHKEIGEAKDNPRRAAEIEKALSEILGKKVYIPANPLEFELSKEDLETLKKELSKSVGKPLQLALKKKYEDYNERKTYLQQVVSLHEKIGEAKLAEAISKWRVENNKESNEFPSKETMQKMYEGLKQYFTVLPTAFSTGLDDGTTPNAFSTLKADKVESNQTNNTRSELRNNSGGKRYVTTSYGKPEITPAGVASLAYTVQGIDGAIAIKLMKEYGIMNAHDGFGFAYDTVLEGTAFVNQQFLEITRNHTLWDTVRRMHSEVIEAVSNNVIELSEKDKKTYNELPSTVTSIKWEEDKNKMLDEVYVVQQYYFPDGGYYPNGKMDVEVNDNNLDAVTESLVKEFTDQIESEFKSIDLNVSTQFKPDRHVTVNADNVVPLFEQLVANDTVVEDPQHLDHLRKVLSEIVTNVMVPVEMEIMSKDVVTAGAVIGTADLDPRNNRIELRIARESSRVNPQQGVGETLVHELGHHVIEAALVADTKERKMLDAIYQAVKKAHPNASSMYPENATQEEKELMDNIYDHVFRNTQKVQRGAASNSAGFAIDNTGNNYLSEFVQYALTNKAFMQMMNRPSVVAILNKYDNYNPEATGRSWLGKSLNTATDWAIAVFKRLITVINNKLYGVDGQLPSEMVFTLAGRLAGSTARAASKLDKIQRMQNKLNTALQKAIVAWVLKPIVNYKAKAKKAGKSARISGVIASGYKLYLGRNIPQFRQALRKAFSRIDLHEDSLARALAREIQGRNGRNSIPMLLHSMANKFVDQLRISVRNNYVEHLRELFSRDLTKQEKSGITSVVLETDLSTLLERGMSVDNIVKLLKEKNTLNLAINDLKNQIRENFPTVSGYYINMAHSMARRMAGLDTDQYDTPFNAYMLARLAGNTTLNKKGIDFDLAEEMLDRLVTLEALTFQSKEDLNSTAKLFETEKVAMTAVLDLHSQYKLESYKSLFKSRKPLMIKGYVKEQFDPNVHIIYAPAYKEAELKKEGYVRKGKVSKDKYDDNLDLVMYTTDSAGLARYNAGAVSLDGMNAKGADIDVINRQQDEGDGNLSVRQIRNQIAKDEHLKVNMEGHKASPKFEPVFNEAGVVVNYRYMMRKKDKIELLDKNMAFDEVMAVSEASKSSKKNAEMVGAKVVEWLWEDFTNNYAQEPYEYIELSESTKIAEHREMFNMLPTYFKENALGYFKDGRIMVRKDEYRMLFGYRKWSISELGKIELKNAQNYVVIDVINRILKAFNTKPVKTIEAALQELATMFKDVIVVKTGATLIANIISNIITLYMRGVSLSDIVKGHVQGWSEVNKYQELLKANAKLELKLKGGRNLTASERREIKAEIASNKQRMLINPAKDLVDEGVYQTIAEDVADLEGNYTLTSKVEEWAAPVTDRLPNVVKDAADVLFMTHNTRMYKFLRNATQVSDFAARYVLHTHNVKQGMDKRESINDAIDLFVNYDLPTHKGLQYLNDMGLLLFFKYILRTQKMLFKLVRDRPASVAAVVLSQYALGVRLPDITDSVALPSNLIDNFNDPVDSIDGVLGIHMLGNGML